MRTLRDLKLKYKLWLLITVELVGLILIAAVSAMFLKESIIREKQLQTRHLVEAACGIIDYYHRLSQSGNMPEDAARSAALAAVRTLRYGETEYFWINDMQPRMVMHPLKEDLNGKDLADFRDPLGKRIFVEFTDVVRKDKAGFVYYLWPKPNFSKPVPKLSYVKGFEPWGWIIGTGIYIDDVNRILFEKLATLVIIIVSIMAMITLLSWAIVRNITGPLTEITGKIDCIADKDLRVALSYESRDEIGQLSMDINRILETMRTVIRDMSDKTVDILRDATALSLYGKTISRRVERDLDHTLAAVSATATMSASTNEIAQNIAMVSQETESAKNASVQGKLLMDETVSSVQEVNRQIEMASQRITALAAFSLKIDEMVDMIKEIAEQTNLLALNASIEAARAGEQGRGFAVVADEVRLLAQRTATATREISGILNSIQSGTMDATAMMDDAVAKANRLEEIAGKMDDSLLTMLRGFEQVSDMVLHVVSATERQASMAGEISDNLNLISDNAAESSATVKDMVLSFENFGKGAKDFLRLLNDFNDPILMIRVLKADYVLWLHRVMDLVDGKETLYVPSEFHVEQSRMGKWYYGENSRPFRTYHSYRDLETPHNQLHESGASVYAAIKRSDRNRVNQLTEETLSKVEEIVGILNRLEQEFITEHENFV